MTKPLPWSAALLHLNARHLIACMALGLACCWAPAQAQTAGCNGICDTYANLLMAPERELIDSIRPLQMVTRPAPGPRNTRGRWVQRGAQLGDESFDTTFYLKSGLVQRIEMVSTAADAQCRTRTPWAGTIAALEAWQGKEAVQGQFDMGNSVQQTVHWAAADMDVSVYLSVTPEACSTKIAFKKPDVKDASEL